MKINLEYADITVTKDVETIKIYGNNVSRPIMIVKNGEIFCYGMDDDYDESDHLKVFLLDA